jgi:dolichyl-phosphate-mannose--protein O-mannosyl transferase
MKKYWLPILIFIVSVSLALYNVSGFPKMIGDEGIYVSQAYWLTHLGRLGPYTYWYDHFPLGWLQIGLWQRLVGPLAFFGHAVLSARVLMAITLGSTTTLLYLLARKLTASRPYATLAAFIFATSTLTLTFGRMVLLDKNANLCFIFIL